MLNSRYSINSLKHHFTASYLTNLSKRAQVFLGFKYAQRATFSPYTVVDASFNWEYRALKFNVALNNLLDTVYSETNLVPMPGRNILLGGFYNF